MRGTRRRALLRGGLVGLLVVAVGPSAVQAGSDYSDKDFSVRMPPAFVRLREVTTFGGETAANRFSSAINPASADWTELPGRLGLVLSPYYSYIRFGEGNEVHVFGEAVTWDTGEYGVIRPVLNQIRTNEETLKDGRTFDFTVNTLDVLWAKRVGPVGLGFNFTFSDAEVVNKLGPLRVAESHAESYRFRFGGLYEPAEQWLAGLVFEYGFVPTRVSALTPTPMGPVPTRSDDTQHQFILRPGVSYEYADLSTVFVDYQYGVYFNDDHTLNHHRFNAGVEHRLLKWLFVRLGGAVDARGNLSWSAGVGAHLSEYCSVDLGYQYDPLPELRPEFGRSQALQFVLAIRV